MQNIIVETTVACFFHHLLYAFRGKNVASKKLAAICVVYFDQHLGAAHSIIRCTRVDDQVFKAIFMFQMTIRILTLWEQLSMAELPDLQMLHNPIQISFFFFAFQHKKRWSKYTTHMIHNLNILKYLSNVKNMFKLSLAHSCKVFKFIISKFSIFYLGTAF